MDRRRRTGADRGIRKTGEAPASPACVGKSLVEVACLFFFAKERWCWWSKQQCCHSNRALVPYSLVSECGRRQKPLGRLCTFAVLLLWQCSLQSQQHKLDCKACRGRGRDKMSKKRREVAHQGGRAFISGFEKLDVRASPILFLSSMGEDRWVYTGRFI